MKKIAEFKLGDYVQAEISSATLNQRLIFGFVTKISLTSEASVINGAKFCTKKRVYTILEYENLDNVAMTNLEHTVHEYVLIIKRETPPIEELLTHSQESIRHLGKFLTKLEAAKKRAEKRRLERFGY